MSSLTGPEQAPDNSQFSAGSRWRYNSRWLWTGVIAAMTVAAFLLTRSGNLSSLMAENAGFATRETGNSEQIHHMPVRVEPIVRVQQISRNRQYTGVIRAKKQAGLGFEMAGRLAEVFCEEGVSVNQGEPLARLDTRTLQARRAATMAMLEQAIAVLNELQAGPRVQTVESTRAQLNESLSRLKVAELDYARRKKLHDSNAISVSEFEAALYRYRAAESNANSMQKQLDELEAGTRPERIAAQSAAVASLEAAMLEIDVEIEKSSLTAPFAGRIVQRMADPGEIVKPSQPILRLVESENLEAVVGLPAEVAFNLYIDQSLPVTVQGQRFDTRVLARIQQLDTATRTQDVVLQLDSAADDQVLPGQLCEVEIESPTQVDGFWVPATSLKNGIRGLWTLLLANEAGDRAVRRDVEVIYTDGQRALVRGPLQDGARVIIDGTHRIVAGQPIQIVPANRQARANDLQP